MAEVASAYVALLPSFRGGASAISRELGGPLDTAGRDGGQRFGGGMRSSIAGMATRIFAPLAAAASGVAITGFLRGAVDEASGLGESVNALNVVFGDASEGVQEMGRAAAQSLGLSNLEFNNLAVQFSNFAKTVAGPGGDVVGTLDDLTTRAADFASVMNLDVNEAATLFQSGLAGETEPLRRYGIDLSAATVQAYAYANGIAEQGAQLTQAQKVQAAYGSLMAQTAQTQGDFANTSDSLANQQRILGASWDNLTGKIGTLFLPVVTEAVNFLTTQVVPAITGVVDTFTNAGGGFDGIVAVWQQGVSALGSWLTGGGMSTILDGLIAGREQMVSLILELVPQVVDTLASALPGLISWLATSLIPQIIDTVTEVIPALLDMLPDLLDAILGMLPDLLDAGLELFAALIEAVVETVPDLVDSLLRMLPSILQTLLGMLPRLITAALDLFLGLVQGLMQALPQILDTLLGTVLPQLITTLLTMLPDIIMAAIDLFMGLVTGIIEILPQLIDTLINVVLPNLITTLVDMVPQLMDAAVQLFTALIDALIEFTPQLIGMVIELIPQIVEALISGIGQLIAAGGQLLGGLWDGLVEAWPQIWEWVKTLPDLMLDGLGNLGQILLDAGKQIMEGLWNGLKDKWGDVQDWFGGIGDWITEHKGPKAYDLALLVPAGRWIMTGLQRGLEDEIPNLRSTLTRVTDEIRVGGARFDPSTMGAAAAAFGRPVEQTNHFHGVDLAAAERYASARMASALREVPA